MYIQGGDMMNYYLKKRLQNNIKRSDMAKMLGVNYNFYYAIEKGSVKMPLNLIDKFNEIINRGKENEIIGAESTAKANEFWKEVSQKDDTGHWVLVNKMHEFNIKNFDELVALLGYKSVGTIYNYLQGRNPVGDEFKKRLYNFFSDETNIQIPKPEPKRNKSYKIGNMPRRANPELDEYYKNTDFKKIMRENYITNVDIANAVGVHNSTISNATCKKYKPSYNIIQKIKDYLDEHTTNWVPADTQSAPTTQEGYISKQAMIDACNREMQEYQQEISNMQAKIAELNAKIDLDAKLIELINKL